MGLISNSEAGSSVRDKLNRWLGAMSTTKPVQSAFTIVNQGTATVTDTDRGIVLHHVDHASIQTRILAKSIPATPFTLTVLGCWTGSKRAHNGFGIGFRKSSTAEIRSAHVWTYESTSTPQVIAATIATLTSSVSNQTGGDEVPALPIGLRITDNGTTRTYSFSNDGDNFVQITSENTSSYISDANQIVAYTYLNNTGGAAIDMKWLIQDWIVT